VAFRLICRTDTVGEFRVGHLFVGVSGRRACFRDRSWLLGGHQDDQRQRPTEFVTRSTARGARTIMARKLGIGVLLAVTRRLYFRSSVPPFDTRAGVCSFLAEVQDRSSLSDRVTASAELGVGRQRPRRPPPRRARPRRWLRAPRSRPWRREAGRRRAAPRSDRRRTPP